MSSEVDIANLALSHLGDEAAVIAIKPPDGSIQSALCGRFYPIARGVLLEAHPWTFATKRTPLAELVTNPAEDDWAYAYSLPSTCIRPLSALLPGQPERSLGSDSHPYVVEAGEDGDLVLFTNVETATLRYIDLITDTTKFTPGFTICLARLLAAYLAGPILRGKTGMQVSQEQMKWFALEYAKATTVNANSGKRDAYETRTPEFIAARGSSSTWPDATILRT